MRRVAICAVAVIACALAVALFQRSARSAETCSTPWWFASGRWTWWYEIKDASGRVVGRAGYDTKLTRVIGERRLTLTVSTTENDPACPVFRPKSILVDCKTGDFQEWPPAGQVRLPGPVTEQMQRLIGASCALTSEAQLH